jgi:hypothetical protein
MLMFKALEQILYVQVYENRFDILHAQENMRISEQSAEPFTTQRLGIGHWAPAEKTLNKAFSKVCPKKFFKISPIVVMHQMVKNEGGLSEIENRALMELALGAGARKVVVWSGEPLTREQLLERVYESAA